VPAGGGGVGGGGMQYCPFGLRMLVLRALYSLVTAPRCPARQRRPLPGPPGGAGSCWRLVTPSLCMARLMQKYGAWIGRRGPSSLRGTTDRALGDPAVRQIPMVGPTRPCHPPGSSRSGRPSRRVLRCQPVEAADVRVSHAGDGRGSMPSRAARSVIRRLGAGPAPVGGGGGRSTARSA